MGAALGRDVISRPDHSDGSIPSTDSDAPFSAGSSSTEPAGSSPTEASSMPRTASTAAVAEREIARDAVTLETAGLFGVIPSPALEEDGAADDTTKDFRKKFHDLDARWTLLDRAIRSWPAEPVAQVCPTRRTITWLSPSPANMATATAQP